MTPSTSEKEQHRKAFDKALAVFAAHSAAILNKLARNDLSKEEQSVTHAALRVQISSIILLDEKVPYYIEKGKLDEGDEGRIELIASLLEELRLACSMKSSFPTLPTSRGIVINVHAIAAFAQLST